MSRIAFATCAALPELDPDDRLLLPPLAARGIEVIPAVWDDQSVDWNSFDLVVVRSTWDYSSRRDEFVKWAESVPRLVNPAEVLRWNTDKQYLRELSAAGAPVIETQWLSPGAEIALPTTGEWVLKPAVSAGSRNTGRYVMDEPGDSALAHAHAAGLLDRGHTVMVQPFVSTVDTDGETAMLFFGGVFSHAIRKGPILDGPSVAIDTLYRAEEIDRRTPTDAEFAAADAVLGVLPWNDLLYARVDLLNGADGKPVLLELELSEPSLFVGYAEGAAERFADAVAKSL
jgi:hypothetical protein